MHVTAHVVATPSMSGSSAVMIQGKNEVEKEKIVNLKELKVKDSRTDVSHTLHLSHLYPFYHRLTLNKHVRDDEQGFTTEPGQEAVIVTEQDRIDTIVRSFQQLPDEELALLGLDLSNKQYLAGTEEAQVLFTLWEERQKTLQEVMKTMMKPAEYMASLLQKLMFSQESLIYPQDAIVTKVTPQAQAKAQAAAQEHAQGDDADAQEVQKKLTEDEQVALLAELEDLLGDVDNARDFHIIGGWPILVSFLHPTQPMRIRSMASWCIGTMVKNSYESQLFLLEPVALQWKVLSTAASSSSSDDQEVNIQGVRTSALRLLLSILDHSIVAHETEGVSLEAKTSSLVIDLQKKVLYAFAAAVPGNLNIHEALLSFTSPAAVGEKASIFFFDVLLKVLRAPVNHFHPSVVRKVWTLLSDFLEERHSIYEEVEAELKPLLQLAYQHQQAGANVTNMMVQGKPLQEIVNSIQSLELLGDHILDNFATDYQALITNALQTQTKTYLTFAHLPSSAQESKEEMLIAEANVRNLLRAIKSLLQQLSVSPTDLLAAAEDDRKEALSFEKYLLEVSGKTKKGQMSKEDLAAWKQTLLPSLQSLGALFGQQEEVLDEEVVTLVKDLLAVL